MLLLAAFSLGVGVSPALAKRVRASPRTLPGSNFQGGDGDQADAPPLLDWQGLQERGKVGHTADCPPSVASPCPTASDDIFGGGDKELSPGDWSLTVQNGGGANPASANILDSYRAFHHGTGDAFLYLAFTREASEGTVFITFELNQAAGTWFNGHASIPCRTTGDILIAFEPHGNVLDNFQVEEWISSATDPTTHCATEGTLENVPVTLPPSAAANAEAAFNDGPINNYLPPTSVTTIGTGDFGEAAINLSSLLSGDQEGCARFASIWMYSQSSSSGEPSQMKDYVAPSPVLVRTCKASPTLSSTASGTAIPGSRRSDHPRHAALRKRRLGRHSKHRTLRPGHRVVLGTAIFDTAQLSGGDNPTGMITFRLYGPNDSTCSGAPVFTSTVPVETKGSYISDPYTPTAVGTYSWTVEYSGDDNNNPAGPTSCGISSETVAISPPPAPTEPTLVTVASMATVLGSPISDSATLADGSSPTGSVTFDVYGPNPTSCTAPAAPSSTVTVHGNGTYHSAQFTPTSAGMYRWVAKYSGDDNNKSAATSCGDVGETVVVSAQPAPAKPNLTSTASGGGPVGSAILDTAHLSGGSNPTGTITFAAYGPNDATCGTPAAPPSTVPVSGAGDYHSAPFTPTAAGTYRWVVSYSGDANNAPTTAACGGSAETVVVTRAQPAMSTLAAPVVVRSGAAAGDTAHLTGGSSPRGTITFRLYGPNDNSCSAPPIFVGAQNVIGNGAYASPLPTPAPPGTYRWVATYSGDANNAGAATACGDASETIVVLRRPITTRPDEPKPRPKRRLKPLPPLPPPTVTG